MGENPQLGVFRVTESVAEFPLAESDELPQELNPINAMAKAEIRVKRFVCINFILFREYKSNRNHKARHPCEFAYLTQT